MGSVDADPILPDHRAGVRRPVPVIVAVAVLAVVLDQLAKWWAVEELADGRTIDLFWTLRLRLLYNRGTAFSLTDDTGPVVSVIALVVVAALLWSGRRQRSRLVVTAYGLVVGGTLGNLVDRVAREGDRLLGGGVVDFVDLQWFPVFNSADALLTVGIALLLVAGFFTDAFDEPAGDDPTERSAAA